MGVCVVAGVLICDATCVTASQAGCRPHACCSTFHLADAHRTCQGFLWGPHAHAGKEVTLSQHPTHALLTARYLPVLEGQMASSVDL